jgi:acetolactate synthase I/III small subunit
VLEEPEEIIEQVVKLLHRVIEVVKVANITALPHIERELALLVVELPSLSERHRILDQARRLGAVVIDTHNQSVVLEAAGDQGQIEEIIGLFDAQGIRELVRSGKIVLPRTHWAKKRDSGSPRPVSAAAPAAPAEGLAAETPA